MNKMRHPHVDINHFVNRYHDHYRCIFINDEIFYKVEDEAEFYKALGYTSAWRSKNYVFEEYFWTVFRSPRATRHGECLTYLLMTYLNQVSAEFRALYGDEYSRIKGHCNFKNRHTDSPCSNCMHQASDLKI